MYVNMAMGITAIILTKNEEKHIGRSLSSLSWCDEIIVVDDESTDQTVAIAKKYNAKVFLHPLSDNFSKQRNFAMSKASSEWIFFVDADEVVSKELQYEIKEKIQDVDIDAYLLTRKDTLWGKKIHFGENGKITLIRLARKNKGKWTGKVHEVWEISGKIGILKHSLHHYPHQTLSEFFSEINFYSTLRAEELFEQKIQVHWFDLILYPKAKFLQNYIFKKGFLDGLTGFILAIIMSFHSFLVRGKLWQLWQEE